MSTGHAVPADGRDNLESTGRHGSNRLLRLSEVAGAALTVIIAGLLLGGIVSRYLMSNPIFWIDEAVSLVFMWLAMTGAIIAMGRHEHLRFTLLVDRCPSSWRGPIQAFAFAVIAAFLASLIKPSIDYVAQEWIVTSPSLGISNSWRVASIPVGIAGMLWLTCAHMWRSLPRRHLVAAALVVVLTLTVSWVISAQLRAIPQAGVLLFLVTFVVVALAAGVPIAFCFGLGALAYLNFSTAMPTTVVVNRLDEGMSSFVLVSVPMFVFLGTILDVTGMGRTIVNLLLSVLGKVKAGMSYSLLGSLFIVSGISGSKVSDMATVAPALFPEMKRRGHKPGEMVALLATGTAMADTVPPSIVLIILGSIAGVSIAGLFQSGFIIALVLLTVLVAVARWKARHEKVPAERIRWREVFVLALTAAPALVLPFLIRGTVAGGVATATEVSTIAMLYAIVVGQLLYGGISARTFFRMLVETAALSGAVLLILGTASAMSWAIAQSGLISQFSSVLTSLPGGVNAFLLVSMAVFLVFGCLLEGIPAMLLLAPIMFPIAKQLGLHDIHYSMLAVTAMNIGLMVPPLGVGFYIAARIGDAPPHEVMQAIWPYLGALIVGLVVIAFVPWLSTFAL